MVKRNTLRLALLAAIALALVVYSSLIARTGIRWDPIDFDNFRDYGLALRNGRMIGLYPLPTVFWIFTPLSLTPDWFVVVWVAVPFLICLYLFGLKGATLWVSVPLLTHGALGQIDGWFILPIFWLVENHSALEGVSAALLTFKPQLAFFIVPFMLWKWISLRNRRAIGVFVAVLIILNLPAFIINPQWPIDSLDLMLWRGSQPLLKSRGASLWAWYWFSNTTRWLLPLALTAVIYIFVRAYRRHKPRSVFLLGLLVTPVLFPLTHVTAISCLSNSGKAMVLFTLSSFVALVIDHVLGGWGGIYILIPLAVMWSIKGSESPAGYPHVKSGS